MHDLIAEVQELQVRRKHHIKTTNRLTNAGGALVRRALGWNKDAPDAEKIVGRAAKIVAAFLDGKDDEEEREIVGALSADLVVLRQQVEISGAARHKIELEMKRKVRKLPGYAFSQSVKGFGELGFAVIVGEAGDLKKYSTVDKLWKRLGLAPHDGKAFSTWRRTGGLTAEDWTRAGYAPRRRAEVFSCVQSSLIKHQIKEGQGTGPYGLLWAARRVRTAETHPEWTKGHSAMDAGRVMVKALVSDLWSEWRRASARLPSEAKHEMPVSIPTVSEAA